MTARFMDGTPYAGLEQEMQRIPGFRPRKSGMVICHLENRMGEGRIEAGRACACERAGREVQGRKKAGQMVTAITCISSWQKYGKNLFPCVHNPCPADRSLFSRKAATAAVSRPAGKSGKRMRTRRPGVRHCIC